MKRSVKISLIVIALALLACGVWLVWRGSRSHEPVAESLSDMSRGPSFEVQVVKPFLARPLLGLLPDEELRFDHTSRGAQIGTVEHDRLELRADGWDLLIETDGEGRVAPRTHLVFPLTLGGRHVRLNCQPSDRTTGYLRTTKRANSDELSGHFLVELATCRNADSGRTTNWPPAPLTVRGTFQSLPRGHR